MMSFVQRGIHLTSNILLLGAIAGLIARNRFGTCYSFTLYLWAVFIPETMVFLWPERFYRWDFWLLKEVVHNVLKFAIALELAYRTFHAFPGAQATARRVLFTVLAAVYLGVVAVPTGQADFGTLAHDVLPRILNGTIWIFTAIAALILWYRLPVDPLHKAILIGFVPYLLVFTVGLSLVRAFGWELREYSNYAHTTAYVALLGYWNHAAWRRATEPSRPAAAAVPQTV